MASTPEQELAKVRAKLGHLTFDFREAEWLDTGDKDLNNVLGSPTKGIPYGRIVEVSGWESQGKTALVLTLCAIAQANDAMVIWIDFENSWDPVWAAMRGVDIEKVAVVVPHLVQVKGEKLPRQIYAEEMCSQAEALIEVYAKRYKRIVLAMDSIAAMQTKGSAETKLEDRNMRTNMDLPMFLSALFKKWVGLAQASNVLILAINQLRQKPGVVYGDPEYTPGGKALAFYSHVRVRVGRVKGGKLTQSNKQIGIQGLIKNRKNKAGGLERSEIGYKFYFSGPVKFVPATSLTKEE